jgi:hypothetical protein
MEVVTRHAKKAMLQVMATLAEMEREQIQPHMSHRYIQYLAFLTKGTATSTNTAHDQQMSSSPCRDRVIELPLLAENVRKKAVRHGQPPLTAVDYLLIAECRERSGDRHLVGRPVEFSPVGSTWGRATNLQRLWITVHGRFAFWSKMGVYPRHRRWSLKRTPYNTGQSV